MLFAACGGSSAATTTTVPTTQQRFVTAVDALGKAGLTKLPRPELIGLGQGICADLAEGASIPVIIKDTTKSATLTTGDIEAVVTPAVAVFCPLYESKAAAWHKTLKP
jgi:Protein of unknown function (DUF732)